MGFYTRFRLKRNEDTHSEAVEKVVSRFFVVQKQFQILKSLKRYTFLRIKHVHFHLKKKVSSQPGVSIHVFLHYENWEAAKQA